MSGKTKGIVLEEDEFQKIVAEVEGAMAQIRPTNSLQKSQDGDEDDKAGPPASPEASSPAPESSGPPAAAADASPAPDASASAPPAPAASADPSAPADGADEGPMDVESLTSKYSTLEESDLKMHYLAAKAALMQKMQSAAPAPGASPAPAASAPPAPPAAAPAGPPPAMKAEIAASPGNGGKMAKSEQSEVALAKAQVEQLSQQFNVLVRAVELLAQPRRKAVTDMSEVAFLGKSEEPSTKPQLTREQALAKLKTKASDQSLSKSDRTLINKYSVGSVDVSQIAHLLK